MVALMAPQNAIEVVRGTSRTYRVTVTKPDSSFFDLTGARMIWTIKRCIDDDLPLIQKVTTVPAEGEITVPREGIAHFYLTPQDTQGVKPCDLVFDVWLIEADGKRHCVIERSTLRVKRGVTYIPI